MFFEIDVNRVGIINFDTIKAFHKNKKFAIYDDEIYSLVRRIDKKGDGTITLFEFKEAIEPMDANLRNQIRLVKRNLIEANTIPIRENENIQAYSSNKNVSKLKQKSDPLTIINTTCKTPLRGSIKTPIVFLENDKPRNASKTKTLSQFSSPTKQLDKYILRLNQTANKPTKKVITTDTHKSLLTASKNHERNTSTTMKVTKIISSKNEISSSIYTKKFSPIDMTKFSPLLSDQKQPSPYIKKIIRSPTPYLEKLEISKITVDSLPRCDIINISLPESYGKNSSELTEYDNIIYTLKKFTLLEKELEIAKQDLALKPDFNLNDFFKILDHLGNGALTSSDIENRIKLFDIYLSDEELMLIVNKYDKDRDGLIQYYLSLI